jgi:hypothetical protein
MDAHKRQPWGTENPNDVQDLSFAIQSTAPTTTSAHAKPMDPLQRPVTTRIPAATSRPPTTQGFLLRSPSAGRALEADLTTVFSELAYATPKPLQVLVRLSGIIGKNRSPHQTIPYRSSSIFHFLSENLFYSNRDAPRNRRPHEDSH